MFVPKYSREDYVKVNEDNDIIILLSLKDGRTYEYIKYSDEIILAPYWKQ